MKQTIHLLIKGKVQGVFYRVSAQEQAVARGLSGWVKNTAEGHVEICAQGDPAALQSFVEWCHRGPDRARVEEVRVTETESGPMTGFTILR